MAMGLSEAAAATGVNRSTIYRAFKSGRMSAVRLETGQIEVELGRIVPGVPARCGARGVARCAAPACNG